MFRNFCINKVVWNKENHGSIYFKDTMQIEKLHTCVNE